MSEKIIGGPSKELIEASTDLSSEVVALLKKAGHNAKVGKSGGLSYPSAKEGVWSACLLWDFGSGWSCPGYKKFGGPHWHWFLTTNMEFTGRSYATGISLRAMQDPSNPGLLSSIIRFVLSDPCRLPMAASTPDFKCPDCLGEWDEVQIEPSVFGKFRSELKPLLVSPGSVDPEGWDSKAIEIAFGNKPLESFS